MKTKFIAYLTFLFCITSILSCNKDDVNPPQPVATFTASKSQVQVGEEIQFTNASQNATAFQWSFGDGTTSKEISPRKAYTSSGVFLVSLVSTGAGGSTISTLSVTVVPKVQFNVEGLDDLVALTPIHFTNLSIAADSYLWSFGNAANSTSTDENPVFTYLTSGTFTVTLKAIGAAGESTISKEITVKAATPDLYFIDPSEGFINKLSLDGSGTVSHFLDVDGKGGVGLAYDEVHGKIYFSDYEDYGSGNIWSVNLDGTELTAIVTGLFDPYEVALDVAGGKVYWAEDADEDGNSHIGRANLDGSNPQNVVTLADGAFRAIALDLVHSKMYYYDAGDNEAIYKANLDGTSAAVIIPDVYGYGIYVDAVNSKLYFDEQESELFLRTDLNGGNLETVDDNGTRIYGIAIDNDTNKLYWSGRDSGEIYKADLDGSNKVTLKTDLDSPRGLFLRN